MAPSPRAAFNLMYETIAKKLSNNCLIEYKYQIDE